MKFNKEKFHGDLKIKRLKSNLWFHKFQKACHSYVSNNTNWYRINKNYPQLWRKKKGKISFIKVKVKLFKLRLEFLICCAKNYRLRTLTHYKSIYLMKNKNLY